MRKKERFFTIAQASKRIGVSKQALHDAIKATPPRLKHTKQKTKKTITIEVAVISESDLREYERTISRSHQERGKKTDVA
jgi:predicted DNA-binding protein YlxM (UPF0122 family)